MSLSTNERISKKCRGHEHFEFDMQYPLLPQNQSLMNCPKFQFGGEEYILKLTECSSVLQLFLIRATNLTKSNVQFFAGFKRRDGSYHHEILEGGLAQETGYKAWKGVTLLGTFTRPRLESMFKTPEGLVTVFLRLSFENLLEAVDTCDHALCRMSPPSVGNIREENCRGHKHVEWIVEYSLLKLDGALSSPVIELGAQRYLMDLICGADEYQFRLFRVGPSVEHNVRYFAGMRREDGFYHHEIYSGEVDQKETCVLWTMVKRFNTLGRKFLDRRFLDWRGRVNCFVRMSLEPVQTESDICHKGLAELNTPCDGRIREEDCDGHKHVEWNVKCSYLLWDKGTVNSKVFSIGGQRYLLDLRICDQFVNVNHHFKLRLFRMGPSMNHRVRCFAGVKRRDGSYYHEVQESELDLSEKHEMWGGLKEIGIFPTFLLKTQCMVGRRNVTFFFNINTELALQGVNCTHGIKNMTPRGVGSVSEEDWTLYKKMEWNVEFELSMLVTSPIFSISEQNYFWELGCNEDNFPVLRLFRTGPSVSKSVRWWSFVTESGGFYREHGSMCEQLDLEDEVYAMWKPVGKPLRLKCFNGRIRFVVGLLMEQTPTTSELSDDESEQDLEPVPGEDVVFRVEDVECRMRKSVLVFRVPALRAMFSHNCIENLTGVVRVEDYKLDVFRAFLDFVYRGDKAVVTSANVLELYSVADKYMFEELKGECLLIMKHVTVSHENFSDVVSFFKLYKNDEICKKVELFISQNKDSIKEEVLQDLYGNNFSAGNDLPAEAFLLEK